MESHLNALDMTQLAALAAALGFGSGMRLYAVVFLTGAAGALGWVALPPGLAVLQNPIVMTVAGVMVALEFFADKIPALDTIWDTVHTYIRIPAGAALAAAAFGGDHATWAVVAGLLGGTLAATAHTAKASTRAAVNTSPEPFSNLGMSLLGDVSAPALLWLAFEHPLWFFAALALALVLAVTLIVLTFRFVRVLWRRVSGRAADPAPIRALPR